MRRGGRLPRGLNPMADPTQDKMDAMDNQRVVSQLDKAVDHLDRHFKPLDKKGFK